MQTILVLIAVIVSGAAVAQTEQELDERMVELWKRGLELRARERELPAVARELPRAARGASPLARPRELTPPLIIPNNDASLGPYPLDRFR